MKGSPSDKLLLLTIHGIERAPHLLVTPGLHLGKDKRLMVTADEIDLPSPRCAEVPAENFPTKPFQMA